MSRKYNLLIEQNKNVTHDLNFSNVKLTSNKVDLRSKFNFIYDQGSLGSCTANALCYAYFFDDTTYSPSRLFLYYNERLLDNDINFDNGSTLTQGINALKKYGVCSEITWPYNVSRFTQKPSTNAYTEGVKHEVITSARVAQSLASLKGCLTSGFPFVVGILVYQSFESIAVANTGMVPMPNTRTESILGGHAIICVGYDDTKNVFIMINSWGSSWGDHGFFYLPYQYLTNPNLAWDFWKVTKVSIVTRSKIQNMLINKNIEKEKFNKK
jgi:C1A family cysteine protease